MLDVNVTIVRASLPAFLILTLAPQLRAQDTLRCDLRCTRQPAQFRAGEAIELELAFRASVPNRYLPDRRWLYYRGRDRRAYTARMQQTNFAIQPRANTHDPLRLFLDSPFAMPREVFSDDSTPEPLGQAPKVVRIVLNEWVAFDRPGTYRLSIAHVPYYDRTANTASEVSSNAVELEILPADEVWQNAELPRLLRELAEWKPSAAHPGDVPAAATGIRHLQTEAAAREMARRIRDDDLVAGREFADGLIASPNWKAGLDEMRRLLRDPGFPVPFYYFTDTLAILEWASRRDSGGGRDSAEKLKTEAMVAVIAGLPFKVEKAAEITEHTIDTAIEYAPPGAREALVGELIRVFESLPTSRQLGWLASNHWENLRSVRWVPVLRRLTAKYRSSPWNT